MAGERVAKSKTWPDSPRALAGRLRRAATFLRKIGIEIGFEREGRARTRMIRITAARAPSGARKATGREPSASSASSALSGLQSGQRLRACPICGRSRDRRGR